MIFLDEHEYKNKLSILDCVFFKMFVSRTTNMPFNFLFNLRLINFQIYRYFSITKSLIKFHAKLNTAI